MLPILYKFASDISPIDPGSLPQGDANSSLLKTILQIVFGIIGAIALLMIVISGLRYVISGGNPDRISKEGDTCRTFATLSKPSLRSSAGSTVLGSTVT